MALTAVVFTELIPNKWPFKRHCEFQRKMHVRESLFRTHGITVQQRMSQDSERHYCQSTLDFVVTKWNWANTITSQKDWHLGLQSGTVYYSCAVHHWIERQKLLSQWSWTFYVGRKQNQNATNVPKMEVRRPWNGYCLNLVWDVATVQQQYGGSEPSITIDCTTAQSSLPVVHQRTENLLQQRRQVITTSHSSQNQQQHCQWFLIIPEKETTWWERLLSDEVSCGVCMQIHTAPKWLCQVHLGHPSTLWKHSGRLSSRDIIVRQPFHVVRHRSIVRRGDVFPWCVNSLL